MRSEARRQEGWAVVAAFTPCLEAFVGLSMAESRASIITVLALSLDRLPNEVLLPIWAHLDEPASFTQVNRRFHSLSQDTLWRAKWFLQRYERYLVLFSAIARPAVCNVALIEALLRLGAPLSRNLVQLLHFLRDPHLRGVLYRRDHNIRWGGISFSSYTTILHWAMQLVCAQRICLPAATQRCVKAPLPLADTFAPLL